MIKITPEELFVLTKEVLSEYNIDLGDQPVSVDDYLKLTCYSVLEQFGKLDGEELHYATISAVTALTLENFLLNLKMMQMVKQNGSKF